MSSIYITTHPCAISSLNILFIMAGELVSPKNMTSGSNSPLLVWNATLYLSPSLIQMLLYPHCTSIFEMYFALVN